VPSSRCSWRTSSVMLSLTLSTLRGRLSLPWMSSMRSRGRVALSTDLEVKPATKTTLHYKQLQLQPLQKITSKNPPKKKKKKKKKSNFNPNQPGVFQHHKTPTLFQPKKWLLQPLTLSPISIHHLFLAFCFLVFLIFV